MPLRPILIGVVIPAILALAAGGAARTSAQEQAWYFGGSGLVDDGGQVYISASLPSNLVANGLTYVQVTSGSCGAPATEHAVYEAALSPATGSSQLYVGVLEPIGPFATPLQTPPGAYDAFLFGRGATGGFTVVLNGQTPSVTFSACFRAP